MSSERDEIVAFVRHMATNAEQAERHGSAWQTTASALLMDVAERISHLHERCTATMPDRQHRRCSLRPGHTSPHATEGYTWKAPMSSTTVSDPSAGPRDRFNALAKKIVQRNSMEDAVEALKEVYYEGRGDGERDAKATWGEAIEETDAERAFRVAETLWGDRLISGNREETEKRFVAALAESRAVGMLEGVRKAVPYTPDSADAQAARRIVEGRAFTDDTIGVDTLRQSPRGFETELEKHRAKMEALLVRGMQPSTVHTLLDAVWFLLAVAHQPVPGGVVEIGGSSPAHKYTPLSALRGTLSGEALEELRALRELEQVIRSNNPTAGTMARTWLNMLDVVREKGYQP